MLPRSQFVALNNCQFHVRDWGGTASKIMLCLHGLASTSHMFDLIAPLIPSDYHVYALDQRGHGLSSKPDYGYDFETIAQDIDAILDIINPRQYPVTLVGHSWGAYTALYYAANHPVERVILIDGGIKTMGDTFETWAEAEVKMAPPRYTNRSIDDIELMIRQKWLGSFYRPELLPLALSIFDTTDPNDVQPRLTFANHMQIARALWGIHPVGYFSLVTCPALVVAATTSLDKADVQLEHALKLLKTNMPHVHMVVMPDTAHDIPWHRPKELGAVINTFLHPS